MSRRIYLDHNATTPIFPELKAKVQEWLEVWGNPSSIHWAGRQPKSLMREARQNMAGLLGCDPLELIFTSGGSEANNLALKGACGALKTSGRNQLIISTVEHPSVRKAAEDIASRLGIQLDRVRVNRDGELDLDHLRSLLSTRTALVSVMFANNETGHVLPVSEVVRLSHAVGAWVHCDAVQALGKIPLRPRELGVDLLTISGHKFYALKGCGVLYARKGVRLDSLIHGGGQERGRRAGTENALAIASLGYMCSKGDQILSQASRLRELRDHMEFRIASEIGDVRITGADY
ncbi:MAG: cysteine desulfurase family protein, partial [Bdellovibrionales bacterium]